MITSSSSFWNITLCYDVSQEHVACSFISKKKPRKKPAWRSWQTKSDSKWFLFSLILRPWRWKRHVPETSDFERTDQRYIPEDRTCYFLFYLVFYTKLPERTSNYCYSLKFVTMLYYYNFCVPGHMHRICSISETGSVSVFRWNLFSWAQSMDLVHSSGHHHQHMTGNTNHLRV